MSFEIWITAFRDEDVTSIPLNDLKQRFAAFIDGEDDGTFPLRFAEGPSLARLYFTSETEGRAEGLTVGRPPDYIEFWDVIAGILRDFPCVLYWPSDPACACMGSLELLPHLPADFVEIHGVPFVSVDREKIRNYVRDNQ